MWAMAKTIFCALLVTLGYTMPLLAQAVSILPQSLDPALREQLISNETIYVNGPFTYGLTKELAQKEFDLGPLRQTALTLISLRMAAERVIDLDEPVVHSLPDLIDDNPFRIAITPRHLLTETAGFAVPPKTVPFDNRNPVFFHQVRSAGQIAHSDQAGWQLLTLFLEAKSGKSLKDLTAQYLLTAISPEATVSGDLVIGNGLFIADLVRLLIHSRGHDSVRFLPADLYEQLALRHNWRMHPVDPRRSLGGILEYNSGRQWLRPVVNQTQAGPTFFASPKNGVAFLHLGAPNDTYQDAVFSVAEDRFLPPQTDTRFREAEGIYDSGYTFNGLYVRTDAPTAALKDRLRLLADETITLADKRNSTLSVETLEGSEHLFIKKLPFYFESEAGERLILSPYRQGGYVVFQEVTYRYVGPLGNTAFAFDAMPVALLVMLTSALYLRSQVSRRWRRMALFASGGTLVIIGTTALDYYFWSTALYQWQMPWLVVLWRILLNAGVALTLSVPLFALSFVRKNELPKGVGIFLAPLHLATLSIASIVLFLILIVWGLAGEFSAY